MQAREVLADGAKQLGIALGAEMLDAFEVYRRELDAWGKRANLTAIEGDQEVAIKHFLDSLTCLAAADFSGGTTVVDVGSGAGFPGVPLKVARPGIRLAVVEARRKRAQFLEHLVTTLGLSGVEVIWDRAENVGRAAEHREAYQVAVARAVADLGVLAELCLPLVEVGGTMVAQKGPEGGAEAAAASGAVKTMGGRVERVVSVALPAGYGDRALIVIRKESHTPDKYPRRPGIPEKRPIA